MYDRFEAFAFQGAEGEALEDGRLLRDEAGGSGSSAAATSLMSTREDVQLVRKRGKFTPTPFTFTSSRDLRAKVAGTIGESGGMEENYPISDSSRCSSEEIPAIPSRRGRWRGMG